MKFKWIVFFTLFLGLFMLSSCKEEPKYVLPELTGKTESEVASILDGYLVTTVIDYEENLDAQSGYFSSYGDNLKAGDTYTPGQILKVFIAENFPILPDLNGKNEQEIIEIMDSTGVSYQLMIETNNSVPDQTFSRYEAPFEIGTRVKDSSANVTIYIGYNDPQLPDLSGKMKHEIIAILDELMISYSFEYITNDAYAEDLFVDFVEHEVNDFIADGVTVVINLYQNTFTKLDTNLFISKYVDGGDDTHNQAIELYNPLGSAIDLSDYHIAIYSNGSATVTYIIQLSGTLESNGTYVVTNSEADQLLLDKADLESNLLVFDGNDVVQLRYKNNTYIDTIYQIGNRIFTFNNEVFVRKDHIEVGTRTFNINQWSAYIPTYIEILGTHPIELPTELTFTFIDRDFYDPLGGMILVTLAGINDGDTASFNPGFINDQRMRFLGIDTPETYPYKDPWGPEAKEFTTQMLTSATTIYLQSDPDLGTSDNYGRTLGYIWVDGVLLNYQLIRNGFSWNYLASTSRLVFGNRYIYRWFQDAEAYAIQNGLGIHSK